MEPIIQQVLDRYGVYSAALERELVQSQQRPLVPRPTVPVNRRPNVAKQVARFLRTHRNEWWTLQEIGARIRGKQAVVNAALYGLVTRGDVARELAVTHGGRGRPQRYQWITQVQSSGDHPSVKMP